MRTINEIVEEFEGMADTYLNRHAWNLSPVEKLRIKGNLSVWLRDTLKKEREGMAGLILNTSLEQSDSSHSALLKAAATIRAKKSE